MNISYCIALAMQQSFDIIEACPEVKDVDIDELDPFVDKFVRRVQKAFEAALSEERHILEKENAEALTSAVTRRIAFLPETTIEKICHSIVRLRQADVRLAFTTPDGHNVYEMKLPFVLDLPTQ